MPSITVLTLFAVLATVRPNLTRAQLRPETRAAFGHYTQLTEQRMDGELRNGHFLVLGNKAHDSIVTEEYRTLENGNEIHVPHALVHHWLGGVFLPGATLAKVRDLKQDYNNYKAIYKPDVLDSKLIRRTGDDFDVFLKLYQDAEKRLAEGVTLWNRFAS